MNPLASLSPAGRLTPGRFAVVLVAIYLLSLLSQGLLLASVTSRIGLLPFASAQAALTWWWYAAHARRLRDARRGTGAALGLAIIYALAVVLLLLVMGIIIGSEGGNPALQDGASMLHLFAFIYLLSLLNDSDASVFGTWLVVFVALCLLPYLVSFGFSIWTGTRPSMAQPEAKEAA
jgi:hypothetical protein